MIKVFMNTCIAVLAWWVVGYGIAFGDDEGNFIGRNFYIGTNFRGTDHIAIFSKLL